MNIIRTAIVFLYLVPVFFISLVQLFIGWVYTRIDPKKSELWQLGIVQHYLRTIYRLAGIKPKFVGLENIPKNGEAVLYVSNHRSIFDVILTYTVQPGPVGYISKIGFANVPLLSWWMKRVSCLFLDNHDVKDGLKMVLKAIDMVKGGTSMTIYPEGTRFTGSDEMTPAEFHEGSFKIATKANARVIPIASYHTSPLFEEHKPIIHAGHPVIRFGEPVDISTLSDEDKKHPGKYFRGVILDMLQEIKNEEEKKQ